MESRKEQMIVAVTNMMGTLSSVHQFLQNYNGPVVSYEDMNKVRDVMATLVENVNRTMGLQQSPAYSPMSYPTYPPMSYPGYPPMGYPMPYPNQVAQPATTPKPAKAKGPIHPFPNPKIDDVGSFKNGEEVKKFKVASVNTKDRCVIVTFEDGTTLDIYWKRGYWAKKDECQTKKNMVGTYTLNNEQ
ncbi:Hypothetical protein ORPV_1106 [Orpheovirus IHUMI-LCC2]|uniref:Uncharacterized protein n=1 Tax=Orpheovirus IHUMI-LCC2 TaxID=2023057 RepID=A0A2I2L686_9VIRU|nr:Hypothetical protein ORPV_1106 [Orpheovirus IHUMI-LCC2]SNW63010.1 Hypothetical protein ORPV_1106 [Orpheovirus IHUMI-LCC2]